MEFVIAVIGLVIVQYSGFASLLQRDDWYAGWVDALHRHLKLPSTSCGILLLPLFLPVLLIAVLIIATAEFKYGVLWFVLNLVVLLYAFGRGDLDQQVTTYRSALERDDLQAAFHDAAVFNLNHREGLAESWNDLHRETLSSIPYRYFERYFAVIFWYLLLGAAGALLYRLSELHTDMALDSEAEQPAARRWLWLMEWLPLRLTGLILAVVGNFSQCFGPWRQLLLDRESNTAEILGHYVEGALDISIDEDVAESGGRSAEIVAIQTLFRRALIFVVSVLAVFVIFA